ncbi:hypothetical protein B0T19DRAFT_398314 [Cercophora scortea]|uniref:PX domain-containing protein n=1 Tax=Cercophora scortea TaxID=314031 RepID=A0AAE0IWF9_9PEZI|nr:hypothetical protein B0T19DRAFT_398314 [Cercophora scortea]
MAPPAEISIPTTSLSTPTDGSKPYTLYNITLRLPLRSFVVQKRYSDFLALHQTLVSLVGSPPPAPLPSKSWFKSTVSSPELTEDRRASLERYLRAIAEPPDRRWRDTSAWRAFLNLPSSSTTHSAASASGVSIGAGRVPPAIGLRDANLAAASDPGTWLDLHREMKGALHEARVALGRRDSARENSAKVEAGAAAKRAVERDGLDKLSSSLAAAGTAGSGGARHTGVASQSDRVALMGGAGAGVGSSAAGARPGGRVLGAPLPETERTRELDNTGLLQLQRDTMREQDEDVEALARIVRRQKEMGMAIHDEVNRHVDMLNRVNEDADVVGRKLGVAKERDGDEDDDDDDDIQQYEGHETREDIVVIGDGNGSGGGGGLVYNVLLLVVKCVLAGAHAVVMLRLLLRSVSEALVWLVDLVMLLLLAKPRS